MSQKQTLWRSLFIDKYNEQIKLQISTALIMRSTSVPYLHSLLFCNRLSAYYNWLMLRCCFSGGKVAFPPPTGTERFTKFYSSVKLFLHPPPITRIMPLL